MATSALAESWKGEGTSGAADPVDFREEAGEAALVANTASVVLVGRSSPQLGNRYRTVVGVSLLQWGVGVGLRQEVSGANGSG